nr:cold-shock protein [Vallicoccus soli]
MQWFDAGKGFGFITPDDGGDDVFVHVSQVEGDDGPAALAEGQRVRFGRAEGDRGPTASRVRSAD